MEIEGKQHEAADTPGYKYWAFITYSHLDEKWASWLHQELESYRIPRKLVGRKTPQGLVPDRLFPVFRDRDELASSGDLNEEIQLALRRARNLIVVCSPHAAGSRWVNEEIKLFKALGREDRVLAIIVDGKPNESAGGDTAMECFPPALRYRVGADRELSSETCEILAADARSEGDGKEDAKLKLVAGMTDLEFDDLKQRERRRRVRRRLRVAAISTAAAVGLTFTYAGVADAGLSVPGGDWVRLQADRYDCSVFRHVHRHSEIRRAAAALQPRLIDALTRSQRHGWFYWHLRNLPADEGAWVRDPWTKDAWTQGDVLYSLCCTPDISNETLRALILPAFAVSYEPGVPVEQNGAKLGWTTTPNHRTTVAEPGLWHAAALAVALRRPGLLNAAEREQFESRLRYTHEALRVNRPPGSVGWNMYARQKDPLVDDAYTNALALLALLECHSSDLPWDGSREKRDALLKETADRLLATYIASAFPPGWTEGEGEADSSLDGLTLQIYALLLRAEAQAGAVLPNAMVNAIGAHLERCTQRGADFVTNRGEFGTFAFGLDGAENWEAESINFLWYPWAIDCAVRFLQRCERMHASPEELVRARRVPSRLVVDLGEKAVAGATSGLTFIASETLYGLGCVEGLSKTVGSGSP